MNNKNLRCKVCMLPVIIMWQVFGLSGIYIQLDCFFHNISEVAWGKTGVRIQGRRIYPSQDVADLSVSRTRFEQLACQIGTE